MVAQVQRGLVFPGGGPYCRRHRVHRLVGKGQGVGVEPLWIGLGGPVPGGIVIGVTDVQLQRAGDGDGLVAQGVIQLLHFLQGAPLEAEVRDLTGAFQSLILGGVGAQEVERAV